MIHIDEKLFVDLVFGINLPDGDKEFKTKGSEAGCRCKVIPLKDGVMLKKALPEDLAHVEIYQNTAVIWDAEDWALASFGHEKRMLARKAARDAINASIEQADMVNRWADNLNKDVALRSFGIDFWYSKLSAISQREGILSAKAFVENLGFSFHDGNKDYFL